MNTDNEHREIRIDSTHSARSSEHRSTQLPTTSEWQCAMSGSSSQSTSPCQTQEMRW